MAAMKRPGLTMADFKDRKELSRGAGGVVYVGTPVETGEELKFALKIPDADVDAKKMAGKELKFQTAAKNIKLELDVRHGKSVVLSDHDNIVYFFGAIPEAPGSSKQGLVFELCDGDLAGLIRERIKAKCAFFAEEDLMVVASDLLCALNDLHSAGWVHFDVALCNLLHITYDEKIRLKLADFGLAKECSPGSPDLSITKEFHLDTAPEARRKGAFVEADDAPLLDAW